MSSKIFDSIVSELIFVNKLHESELLKQDAGARLYGIFRNELIEIYPFLMSLQGKLVEVFYFNEKNILSIEKQRDAIKVVLNAKWGRIRDDRKLFRDVSKVGHWGSGDYQIKLFNSDYFPYVFQTIKQLL